MNPWEILGYVAAFLTTVSFVPQVLKTFRDRHTQGISLAMYAAFTTGILFWLLYGIVVNQLPVILANAVTLVLAACVLIMKIINTLKGEK